MSDLKTIKVSDKVKAELDNVRLDKETYNLAIQRLIQENSSLKREKQSFIDTTELLSETVNRQSEELKSLRQDKDTLMKIAMQTEDSIALVNANHSSFFAITQVLKDNSFSDDEKLSYLKVYLKPSIMEDKEAVLSMIEAIKSDYGFSEDFASPNVLDKLSSFIQESYQ